MLEFSFHKKIKMGVLLVVLVLTFTASGCIYVVVGGIGALGGYVASPDTVEGIISSTDFDSVWDAAIEIVSIMGVIEERNESGGVIIAKIQGAKVTIMTFNLSSSSIKLSVKARKAMLPKIKLSQDIYVKIASYIEDGIVDDE